MMKLSKIIPAAALLTLCAAPEASALEGDWNVGAMPAAVIMPSNNIYGAGTDIYARYSVLDGFEVGAVFGVYGAQNTDINKALGIYNLRIGVSYALDILQWVPSVGVHLSAAFSEDETYQWHRGGHGMGLDFEIQIQYRGIRHFGIGIFYRYNVVFTDVDAMYAGISLSWFSGDF